MWAGRPRSLRALSRFRSHWVGADRRDAPNFRRAAPFQAHPQRRALHVALATTNRCRLIVSWNFKHIVHFDKIPLYNGVNLINGYDTLSINTPSEVIDYED